MAEEIDYHRAHEHYVGAVATALTTHGIPVGDYHADANDPRDGAIQLGEADPDSGTEYWLCWTEESGWYHGIDIDGGRGLSRIRWAHLGVLPSPGEVCDWARSVAGTPPEPAELQRPRYRGFADQDDFAAQLADYHPGDDRD